MFKRAISITLTVILIITTVLFPVRAVGTQEYVINLENGDYIEVVITKSLTRGTSIGNTSYTYCDTVGNAQWQAVLRGAFQYDGNACKATSSVCNITIYNDDWIKDSQSTWTKGNTAYASVSMRQTVLGNTVYKDTFNLSLTCDKDGNLS